jgi:protein arginine kinase activator
MFDMARPLMPTNEVLHEVKTLLGAEETSIAMPEQSGALAAIAAEPVPVCPDCGITLSEFKARGRFGCPRDYEVFAEHLDPLFERIHDAQPARHQGRLPQQPAGNGDLVQHRRMVADLRSRLDAAVADENYELAARIRDEINEVEGTRETKA